MKTIAIAIARFIHHHFLWFLLGMHVIAVLLPGPGQAIRGISLGQLQWWDGTALKVTLPVAMLSLLLFNAGLGIQTSELSNLARQPLMLLSGLLANLLLPVVFAVGLLGLAPLYHNPDEFQHLLVGLALVGSMPIAGSSTAWAQNVNGNLSLSLGLVVLSTLLSPVTTPIVLHAFGWMTLGDYSSDLHELASSGVSAFLGFSVVLPSLLGIAAHFLLGDQRCRQISPFVKLVNSFNLLLLIYSNASIALPQVVAKPDWDFLLVILAVTSVLCSLAFLTGDLLAKVFGAKGPDRASLVFALGMNNNGTGLVLSSLALADHPAAMLPIIFYNLVQQIIAGLVNTRLTSEEPANHEHS